jgi:hypothetical protein
VATPTACNSHSAARINTKPTTKIQKNLGLRWLRLGVVRFHRDSSSGVGTLHFVCRSHVITSVVPWTQRGCMQLDLFGASLLCLLPQISLLSTCLSNEASVFAFDFAADMTAAFSPVRALLHCPRALISPCPPSRLHLCFAIPRSRRS